MITHYYRKLILNLFNELNLTEKLTYKIEGVGAITLIPEKVEVVDPESNPVETQEAPVETMVKPSRKTKGA